MTVKLLLLKRAKSTLVFHTIRDIRDNNNINRIDDFHGGLIIYIHNDFEFKELNEEFPITHTSNSFESLFVEVWRKNYSNQKYVIGNIYRLPLYDSDNLTSFTNEYIDTEYFIK